jgi:hypothetical protein
MASFMPGTAGESARSAFKEGGLTITGMANPGALPAAAAPEPAPQGVWAMAPRKAWATIRVPTAALSNEFIRFGVV